MKVRCNQCMKVFDEEKIVYDGETDTEFCPECGESGCLMDLAETRYYVCGFGYDKDGDVTDYETDFGDFDTLEEAYELFMMLQDRDEGLFFEDTPDVYELLIQLEECEETDDEITCIDVKDEFGVTNQNYKEEV